MEPVKIIFVHGYSVTNLDTYGELPLRLRTEALVAGINIQVEEIFLGRYISFSNAVRVSDISRAFQSAIWDVVPQGTRFICITHSTGGPVVRDWWNRYYTESSGLCPMSHLIMLAPANYGSALAQLGQSELSRMASFFEGVQPGQGVLDWLELGSSEAWELNKDWIFTGDAKMKASNVFPFVIIGQDIDRKLYDVLNSYTGESGSDGVIRTAASNLQARYILLNQSDPVKDTTGVYSAEKLITAKFIEATPTPLRVLTKKSHSGDSMGIMKSVKKEISDNQSSETIQAILDCIKVQNRDDYNALYVKFAKETANVQAVEKLEQEKVLFSTRNYIHDRFSMVIFRVTDREGRDVTDFDLVLTAGPNDDPDHLPVGFFADRQRNSLNKNTLTYFLNYDIMHGCDAVKDESGKIIRDAVTGAQMLGFKINPRPDTGFVQYLPCKIEATEQMLDTALHPNGTTLIDICLQRIINKEIFRLEIIQGDDMPSPSAGDFKSTKPGNDYVT
jgi:hypothetical protein